MHGVTSKDEHHPWHGVLKLGRCRSKENITKKNGRDSLSLVWLFLGRQRVVANRVRLHVWFGCVGVCVGCVGASGRVDKEMVGYWGNVPMFVTNVGHQ